MTRFAGSASGRATALLCSAFTGGCGLGLLMPPARVLMLPVLACAAVAAGCALAVRVRPRAVVIAMLACTVLVAGIARGALDAHDPGPGRIDGHLGPRPVAVVGMVRDTAVGGGGPVIVDTERLSDADVDVNVAGGLLVSGPNVPALSPGDTVEVDATGIRAPNTRPGPESLATLEREDVEAVAVAPLVSVTRHAGPSLPGAIAWMQARLVGSVDAVLPEPQAALTLGIAFGIRQPLAADARTPLQDAGLIHIVVVSGLKVVMLLGMVAALGGVLGWGPRRRITVALALTCGYVLLSGAGPAAVRSALMAGTGLLVTGDGRRSDPLPMLALAAALMLGLQPDLVRDPGLQLSFVGTAGILLMARPLAARLPGPRLLAEPFAVTVAAQAATVPVMAGTFGVIAVLGPVANMIVLPALPALIVLGGAGALLGPLAPALAWPLLQLAGAGASLVLLVAQAVSAIPGAAIQVGTWPAAWTIAELTAVAVGLALLLSGARTQRRPVAIALITVPSIAAACTAGIAAAQPDGRLHVTVLSTGAAPAVLVRTPDGSLALVDGGLSPTTLLQALGRVLSPVDHRLGLVVVTGGEEAAVAGLAALPAHYDVGTVIASRDLNPGGARVVAALQDAGAATLDTVGAAWSWGGAVWQCLPFVAQATGRSMCALHVAGPGTSALLLGDTGSADQEELCALYPQTVRAAILVAEPGGALSPVLLSIAAPSVVAVPTAQGGFTAPAPPGVRVLRTGSDGDLALE